MICIISMEAPATSSNDEGEMFESPQSQAICHTSSMKDYLLFISSHCNHWDNAGRGAKIPPRVPADRDNVCLRGTFR